MIKFKVFDVNEYDYEEQMEQFQTEFPQAEFLQITGGHMSPERIWFKYEPSYTSAHTDNLSVEKLQEENKKLRNEIARLSNQTQVDYRGAYEESQEQLNTAKKALTEIRANIEEHNQIYDLDTNTALLLEGIDGIAFDALAAIENEGSGDE